MDPRQQHAEQKLLEAALRAAATSSLGSTADSATADSATADSATADSDAADSAAGKAAKQDGMPQELDDLFANCGLESTNDEVIAESLGLRPGQLEKVLSAGLRIVPAPSELDQRLSEQYKQLHKPRLLHFSGRSAARLAAAIILLAFVVQRVSTWNDPIRGSQTVPRLALYIANQALDTSFDGRAALHDSATLWPLGSPAGQGPAKVLRAHLQQTESGAAGPKSSGQKSSGQRTGQAR